MVKVALYARVSTNLDDDKRTSSGEKVKRQDPEVQLIKLREYCQSHQWGIYREYIDRASGSNDRRDALDELMKDIFSHRFDVVLVVRLDRMMRSLTNLLNIIKLMESHNVRLVATDQMIDTSTATGRLLTNILGSLAEWELEIDSERIRDGQAKARMHGTKSGKPIGRPRLPDDKLTPEALRKRLKRAGQNKGGPSLYRNGGKIEGEKNRCFVHGNSEKEMIDCSYIPF
jgi:site-specific DNA recombinase